MARRGFGAAALAQSGWDLMNHPFFKTLVIAAVIGATIGLALAIFTLFTL